MSNLLRNLANRRRLPAPFYFLHIPKTGGTSLGSHLLSQCPEQLVLNCSLHEMLSVSRKEIQSFSYFAGHFGTLLLDRLDKPLRLITMLRDPLERTVSSIYYGKAVASTSPELAQTLLVRDALIDQSIDEIVNHPYLSLLFVNIQVLHLGCRWTWNRDMLALKPAANEEESPGDTMTSAASPPFFEIFFAEHLHSSKLDMNSLLVAAKK